MRRQARTEKYNIYMYVVYNQIRIVQTIDYIPSRYTEGTYIYI